MRVSYSLIRRFHNPVKGRPCTSWMFFLRAMMV